MACSTDSRIGRFVGYFMYVELHASSAFSFLEAASLPEALIDHAARYGYPALALLDRDGVYGAPRFHRAALAAGIRPIIGAELTLDLTAPCFPLAPYPFPLTSSPFPLRPSPVRLPVLIESREGY